jgi:hypothetical protein
MQITINTAEEISDLDRSILSMLAGVDLVAGELAETDGPVGTYSTDAGGVVEEVEEETVAPTKKKAAPAPDPEPDPEPEPIAEEPVIEPEDEPADEPEDDGVSDEDLLALAVKKATEMVAGGKASEVRDALNAAGASRVRELNASNVRDFFQALP